MGLLDDDGEDGPVDTSLMSTKEGCVAGLTEFVAMLEEGAETARERAKVAKEAQDDYGEGELMGLSRAFYHVASELRLAIVGIKGESLVSDEGSGE